MYRILVAASLLIFMAGCVSAPQVRLADNPTAQLSGNRVHTVQEESPSFGALTADKAMFGAFGALAAHDIGNRLVRENDVVDPSIEVETALAEHLQGRYQVMPQGQIIDFREGDKPGDLGSWARENNVNSLILDAETVGWGFSYFPTVWSRYRVTYQARVRLIDASNGQVIAQHLCASSTPEHSEQAPTYDEMMGNNAAGLKAMLKDRVAACVEEVKAQVL